jgi:competence protein ComEC
MRRAPLFITTIALLVVNIAIAVAILQSSSRELTVAFLDVGQGDAIFIESPTGSQVLIDGGKDRSVLRELGKRTGPFDRALDVVIATHPDADHIGGLPGVFSRYQVGSYLSSGVENDTSQTKALINAAHEEAGVVSYEPRRGDRIHLGGGAYLDILFPDRDVSSVETNTGSIVVRLVYGGTSFLFTGDAPEAIEEYLTTLPGELESEVLKAGHHGSRTSTGPSLLAAVAPGAVVISAGDDNPYGHPHAEVSARIEEAGALTFSTLGKGAVVFISNGKEVRVR